MGSIELRLPNISTNLSDREMLMQIRSYLYQTIPLLQMAFNTVGVTTEGGGGVSNSPPPTVAVPVAPPLNPQITFDKLKPLIIGSSEIIEAYTEEINKTLEGKYVAQSTFGKYEQDTESKFTATSESLTQNYINIQTITSDLLSQSKALSAAVDSAVKLINGIQEETIITKAHIRTGVIAEENGVPIYGVEVGQTVSNNGQETFNKFARFSADKLSFYDRNNVEVAYISDYKLYIGDAEITYRLVIGSVSETVLANGDVVAKRVIKKGG